MLSRRARTIGIAAAAAALVVAVVLVALPILARHLAVRRLEAMTGRPVTVDDVDLNLFTRRIVFSGVRVTAPAPAPPPVQVPRIEGRFRLRPLLAGRVHLERLVLLDPSVHVVRHADGSLSVEDVVEHWLARPAGEPLQATLEELRVVRGRVTFVDQAVAPAREWVMQAVAVEATDIATVADAAAGRASAHFAVGGGDGGVEIERLRVRPLQAHVRVSLDGIDVAPFGAYLARDAAIRPRTGRFSTRVELDYGAGVLQARGASTVRALVLERRGQAAAFVTVPLLNLGASDVRYAGGALSMRAITLAAGLATVLDAGAPRARPLEFRDVTFALHDARVPAAGPGRVTLSAILPGGGTLSSRGTGAVAPPSANLTVEVRDLDAALAQIWLPPDVALAPTGGRAGATVAVRYDRASGLVLGGRAWVDGIELAHAGQPRVLVRDDRVELRVSDLAVDDSGPRLGRLELLASPTIVDAAATPARLFEVPRLELTATGGRIRGQAPTHLQARVSLPHGGLVTARGDARLGVPDASLRVAATNVDVTLVRPYLPAQAPIVIESGRLETRLRVAWAGALDVDGDATLRDLTLRGRGERTPLVQHAVLEASLADLVVRGDGMSLARVTVEGAPVIVDRSVSPPQRFEVRRARLTATDLTWPARGPMRLDGAAEVADGGTARLDGTLHPGTLATDVRVVFDGVDLTRARAYLAGRVPLGVQSGRAGGSVHLRHARDSGIQLDADGAVHALSVRLTAGPPVRVVDERMRFSLHGMVMKDGAVAVGALTVEGTPRLGRGDELAAPLAMHAELRRLAWPSGPPADVTLTARGEDAGALEARGTFAPWTRVLEATVRADDAAIEPFAALLPVEAAVGGRLDARVRAAVRPAAAAPLDVRGDLTLREVRIGPAGDAPVRIDAIGVEQLALEGRALSAARITVTSPSVLIERRESGSFPLRAMLTPPGDDFAAASPAKRTRAARDDPGRDAGDGGFDFKADEIVVTDGDLRFLDRTTRPFYSEELTRLHVTLRDVSSDEQHRAGLIVQGIVGGNAALDLRGEMAPFATPFFLEVAGELKGFSVPRTNPYLQRFLDWIANRGQLTTKVHYRIVGDELTATNELVLHRLDVTPARGRDDAQRMVGLPLGLVVALLKDARGDIRITVPVSGELGSPRFSFGDAIGSALRNVVSRIVTGPFRAIGHVFHREGKPAEVAVDPVVFDPGSAALTPDAGKHLQRVADFLRASPYVDLVLAPVVSDRDVVALKRQEVAARIQALQRRERLDDVEDAARRLFHLTIPDQPPPQELDAIIRALAERAPDPREQARRLAEHRLGVVRTYLTDSAGISPARLAAEPAPAPGTGAGRVEFELKPSS